MTADLCLGADVAVGDRVGGRAHPGRKRPAAGLTAFTGRGAIDMDAIEGTHAAAVTGA